MPRTDRRVVITGLGLLTPLGNDLTTNWEALQSGRSGITSVSRFDASSFPSRMAGEVKGFAPALFIEKKEIKKMDLFIQFALAAAQGAVDDAKIDFRRADSERIGVILGAGMGGIETVEEGVVVFHEEGLKRLSPFFIPRLTSNMAPAHIAMRFGIKGVNYALNSACASGCHAIGEAARLVRYGYQDMMLAGGSEAGVTPICMAGFCAMRAVSTRNEDPVRASRPFDRHRDGFVLAEGAAVLVLESMEGAMARGARPYAEIIGYGATSDAYHITTPSPEGEGAARCMRHALIDAGIRPEDVDYINAHGTSTPYNDLNETLAIKRVFGIHSARLAISATKSMTGHTLGAAGAIETAFTALTRHHQVIPPTITYEVPDPECDLDYVPNQARSSRVRIALTNSFGFGGTNACLALRQVE